jgi:metal-responsive CopG/Arc/MetJ family transcriptional regulator
MKKSQVKKNFVKQKRVGRPVTVEADVAIGIRLSRQQLDVLDEWAATHGVSRSEAIRRLLYSCLDEETDNNKTKRKPK